MFFSLAPVVVVFPVVYDIFEGVSIETVLLLNALQRWGEWSGVS